MSRSSESIADRSVIAVSACSSSQLCDRETLGRYPISSFDIEEVRSDRRDRPASRARQPLLAGLICSTWDHDMQSLRVRAWSGVGDSIVLDRRDHSEMSVSDRVIARSVASSRRGRSVSWASEEQSELLGCCVSLSSLGRMDHDPSRRERTSRSVAVWVNLDPLGVLSDHEPTATQANERADPASPDPLDTTEN